MRDVGAQVRVLNRGRAFARRLRSTTCNITIPGEPTWDNTTGTYTDGAPVVIYSGSCRLRMPYAYPQNAEAGDTAWAVDRGILSVPIAGTGDITDGMTVTITANPHDPAMVGVELTILTGHYQTDATARRLPVQIVSRDAGHGEDESS